MATHLDLEEQEQLDQLKAFWTRYGNWLTWAVIVVLGAFAAWNGWNYWQRNQAVKAGSMFDELDRAAQAGDAQAAGRIFADMKDKYPRTAFAEQAGLLAAKVQFDKGQADAALGTLAWVGANAQEGEYRGIAALRAAGVLLDQKKFPEALKQLDGVEVSSAPKDFAALVNDRRGDVLLASGKREEARASYQKSWDAMDSKVEYRRLVEAKLNSLGAAPAASAAAVGSKAVTRPGSATGLVRRTWLAATSLVTVFLLAACAADKPKPQPLEPLTPKLAARVAWSASTGGNVDFPLAIAVNGTVVTVASGSGDLQAIDATTGRSVWRASAGGKLSAGVGSDGRYAAVVTRDGELVVFDKGQPTWRKPLGVRVTTAPLVAGERVFVMGVDRVVQAFDVQDGRKLWMLQRANDPLALAQNGVLAAFKDTLIAGQGPRMAGVDPTRGSVRWEVPIGSPRGANEIERLADLVGPMARVGSLVCARSFQAAVGCVDADRGIVSWTRNTGGLDSIAADAEFVFAADATDRMTAWKTSSGDVVWTSDKLQYRGLSAPVTTDRSVVYGDADGMVHWLARDSGEAQLRMPTDGGAIVAAPVAVGNTLLVVTRKGGLFAFRPE